MVRPIVSYDDITSPQQPPAAQLGPPTVPPPSKKRRTIPRTTNGHAQKQFQHWDDPGNQASQMNYDDNALGGSTAGGSAEAEYAEEEEEEEEEEESRDLTHEEIWDDSALVDAWNSAMAEYEAFHGPGKKWQEAPVKKSPLWYNVPPTNNKQNLNPSSSGLSASAASSGTQNQLTTDEINSAPLNFDTFVPTHDPSLISAVPPQAAAPGQDYTAYSLPNPPGSIVSQDEAFSRALAAMYWGGYWTAIYHCHRNMPASQDVDGAEEEESQGEHKGDREQDEEMLPTQR
ncbi:hypothetical protein AcV7_000153 [Taiwanofungus camphoratus]|nr:hypothetical protein AcV7_000153 [Antrodia cinnamomea]